MSFLEMLSMQINCKNIDMTKQSHGTSSETSQGELLAVLSMIHAPKQYKNLFVYRAMTVPSNPVLPDQETENLILWDCRDAYVNKLKHQKRRNYFIIPKDLEQDEIKTLARVATFSQIENTKKTKKYYCDLLECARSTFNDKYLHVLDMFCHMIDNQLHKIEQQAQKIRFNHD